MYNLQRFLELCNIYSISGFENDVRKYVLDNIDSKKYSIIKDPKGSVFAYKKSSNKNAKSILIAAHFDEVGFLVSKLNKNGTVSIIPIGGINPRIMLSCELLVKNSDGKLIPGVIGGIVPHLTKGKNNFDCDFKDLKLDLGFDSIEELEKNKIYPGSQVFFKSNFNISFNKKKIFSKSIDNRIGCGIVLDLIKNLEDIELDYNLYLAFHTQEEVGLRGAKIASQNINPDIVIAIDTSPIDDINNPDSKNYLGKGPMIRVYDPGNIMKNDLRNYLKDKFNKYNINYQEYLGFGGTDANAYNLTNSGIISTALVIPARYIHTSCGVCDISDIENEVKFLTLFLKNLKNCEIIELVNSLK